MRYILVFFSIFALYLTELLTYSNSASKVDSINFNYNVSLINQLFNELANHQNDVGSGEITAVINDYADKVFENVKKLIIRSGLDPVEIPDQTFKLIPTGTINLTRGWLEDTSTIARYNDVVAKYQSTMKKLTFTVPVKFHTLMFIYKYHTKILLLNITGDIQGKITNVRANISLSFDFDKYLTSLDKLDITDTGSINLTFSGNGMIDWLTNTMTNMASFFLHPILIRIIQYMIKDSLNKTVIIINKIIKDILQI